MQTFTHTSISRRLNPRFQNISGGVTLLFAKVLSGRMRKMAMNVPAVLASYLDNAS